MKQTMPQNALQISFYSNEAMPESWPPWIASSNKR